VFLSFYSWHKGEATEIKAREKISNESKLIWVSFDIDEEKDSYFFPLENSWKLKLRYSLESNPKPSSAFWAGPKNYNLLRVSIHKKVISMVQYQTKGWVH